MKEYLSSSVYLAVSIVLISYFVGLFLRKRLRHPLVNPLLIATLLSVLAVIILPISYEDFAKGAQPMTFLMTPATICFALPLYEQLEILIKHRVALLVGAASGVASAMLSVFLLCKVFSIPHEVYVSMLSKSVTTAIGIALTEEMGGYVAITIAGITIAGLLGHICAVSILRLMHITEPIAKGVAIGAASHVAGTAKAMEIGDLEGAVSTVSLILCGLITVIGANLFAPLL